MTTLWHDIIYGFRMLLKKPGFTVVAALSLALGIGANTVIFSLINTTLLRPLAFHDPGRLLALWTAPLQHPNQRNTSNLSAYLAWKEQCQSYESMGAFSYFSSDIGAEENGAPAEKINGQYITPSLLATLAVKPVLGRVPTEEEGKIGDPAQVVVISNRLWQRRYNGDSNVLGKIVRLDNVPTTIIGVMAPGFDLFWDEADFWGPGGFSQARAQSAAGLVTVVGRLKPGVSMKQAQAEMDAVASRIAAIDPRNKGNGASVQPLQDAFYGGLRQPLLLLQGAVAFVLLIGCANVAGLLLARAASRRTEVAIRTAIGAGRMRIVRQLLTESVLLACLGGVLGAFLAWGGLRLFIGSAPPGFPRLSELSLDAQVLGFTALIALLTGLLFGIVPAMQASKSDLVEALRDSSRGASAGVTRLRLRSGLVTVQIGLALVLLIGAGLMINSFVRIQNIDLGMDPRGLLTFDFRFPALDALKRVGLYRGVGLWDVNPNVPLTFERLLERMNGLPGVTSAAAATAPPLQGAFRMEFLIDGRPAPPPTDAGAAGQTASYIAITPNYFATLKIPLLRGRDFNEHDNATGTPVIIINQAMAKRYWPGEDPIGRRITLDLVPGEPSREIIAVTGDTRLNRSQREPRPILFAPFGQQAPHWRGPDLSPRAGMTFVLRTSGDPLSLVPSVRRAAAEVDRNKPVSNIRTVEEALDQQIQYTRLYVLLLGIFGGIAAVLAAVGIYGIMAYMVAQRTQEIGIRVALGASGKDVLNLVLREALVLIAIGLVLGLGGSLALTRLLASALWGVTATDPATYAGVSILLAAVALVATFIPARRAVQVDPTVALKYE